jgi:hypothetical protein
VLPLYDALVVALVADAARLAAMVPSLARVVLPVVCALPLDPDAAAPLMRDAEPSAFTLLVLARAALPPLAVV